VFFAGIFATFGWGVVLVETLGSFYIGFLRRAICIARGQQARSWELRASTSLARLCYKQGKPAEARSLLAPVYAWFSEGLDTPDLTEAAALLNELR
jgi:predicted ATPase